MLGETPRALFRVARSPLLGQGERAAAAATLVRLRLFRFALNHRLALAAPGEGSPASSA
jgi:hypothetical protein